MINRSQDQVNTILALSKSPPSAAQIRRLAYAFDWRKPYKPCKVLGCHGTQQMAPRNGEVEAGKTQMTWIINESKWPKMKGLCSSWFLMDSLSAVTTFEALWKIQLARCHGMPNASEKSNLRLKKSDKLERLLHHPDISSCIFSTFHWSRMALDTQKASTPSSVFGFNTGEDSFRSHDQTERFVFLVYLFAHTYMYIYIHIHGFFLNIVNDSWNSQM